MKKLTMFSALMIGMFALAHDTVVAKSTLGNQSQVLQSALSKESAAVKPAGVKVKVKVGIKGSGFLCLSDGNSCEIEVVVVIGLVRPDINGSPVPNGAGVGLMSEIDNQPIPPGPPADIGGRILHGGTMIPEQQFDVTIPPQTGHYDPELGGYLFYYFEN